MCKRPREVLKKVREVFLRPSRRDRGPRARISRRRRADAEARRPSREGEGKSVNEKGHERMLKLMKRRKSK